jgi:hypothetical protein
MYRFYKPIDRIACNAPDPIRQFTFWYFEMWGPWLWGIELPVDDP